VDAFKGTVGWFQLFKKEEFIEEIRYCFCALNFSILIFIEREEVKKDEI